MNSDTIPILDGRITTNSANLAAVNVSAGKNMMDITALEGRADKNKMGIAGLDMKVNANTDTTNMGAQNILNQNNKANNAETTSNINLVDISNLG